MQNSVQKFISKAYEKNFLCTPDLGKPNPNYGIDMFPCKGRWYKSLDFIKYVKNNKGTAKISDIYFGFSMEQFAQCCQGKRNK